MDVFVGEWINRSVEFSNMGTLAFV